MAVKGQVVGKMYNDWQSVTRTKQSLPKRLRAILDRNRPQNDLLLPLLLTADDCLILRLADFEDWFGEVASEVASSHLQIGG